MHTSVQTSSNLCFRVQNKAFQFSEIQNLHTPGSKIRPLRWLVYFLTTDLVNADHFNKTDIQIEN